MTAETVIGFVEVTLAIVCFAVLTVAAFCKVEKEF